MIHPGVRTVAGVAILLSSLLIPRAQAGTAGKLSGRVLDPAKQPIAGANVAIPAARTGALTQADGSYFVLNLPAGQYDVRVNMLGYQPVLIQGVVISADNTTSLDVTLQEAPVQMPDVVVSAQRPVVDVNQTSQIASVSRKELNTLPVQELQEVVNLQAGVVDGHFRGGRTGEVQYQVDGVTVNNPYDNKSSLRLDRSLLEEVQVISGTFDAEYGQAMSGVVNAVLRSGGDRFRWDAETFAGGYYYGGNTRARVGGTPTEINPRRLVPCAFRPADVQNYQLTLSGPLGLAKTRFLVTGRYYHRDDYVRGVRLFVPTDTSDFERKLFYPTGDRASVPLAWSREWSGVAKFDTHAFEDWRLGYQAIANSIRSRRGTYGFRLNPDGLSRQRTFSIVHGFDVTRALGKSSFFNATVRQNYFDYHDMVYDALDDPRYDAAGPPQGDTDFDLGAFIQGVEFTRFAQTTNALVAKGVYESQLNREHHLKLGAEYQVTRLRFGHPGYLVYATVNGQQQLVRHVNEPPDYPAVSEYRPVVAAGFAQDEVEWNNLRLRGGLRLDSFDARASLPSDLANPANAIAGAPRSELKPTRNKVSLAPRLGVSYPVTRDAAVFFAYGHFYQMPALGTMFDNADYRILRQLQAGGISYGVLGNPDIRPERTVQYQFGYKQAVTDWLGLDASVFYKDIRDLLGVEFVSTYNGAEYARLTNVDFGSVIGFTLALDQRQLGRISSTMDYTWEFAQGNSSDPRETATRASAGEDPRPRLAPLDWDQRHTLNLTVSIAGPGGVSSSAVLRVASGQPYTPALVSGFAGGLETNSGRKPTAMLLDLRSERPVRLAGLGATVFARAFNVFDTRYFNGFVFDSSGSPYYSRYGAADVVTLNDPTRYYPPRRIEIGIGLRDHAQP
ncbi:MAG: TonB-dependent receptor [Candidatus Eisenbacteria bacterium]|uniref:TonB-dependent receptor n=1 Tax=Eiseniibacteriota bacterium TaxID=2212470 RepID=A0A538UC84_UNCEI|nr:MAG: TonB-dependent receptor [Candidatus Eisenbacteria bacterium]